MGCLITVVATVSFWMLLGAGPQSDELQASSMAALRRPTGYPQLISYQALPEMEGEMCEWVPASSTTFRASLSLPQSTTRRVEDPPDEAARLEVSKREPVRVIRDPSAVYSAVAVDAKRNEVVIADENNFNILVYDRLTNTPPTAAMSEPKRMIGGYNTKIEFQCDLYIDPASGDIYAVNNDTVRRLGIFSRQAKGNVAPDRELVTPYGAFGIAVHEGRQELFLTIQHAGSVVVYHKMAKDEDAPIRILQGEHTRLADPHGIALDLEHNLMFIANWGSAHSIPTVPVVPRRKPNWPIGIWNEDGLQNIVPGSGEFRPPSITVHAITASGDIAPLRVFEGPKTQLNWPTGVAVHPERGEIFVANDMGDAVLVFDANANGDVAPIRVLKGPNSLIKNPTDVFLDLENNELWTTNYGNHTVTIHRPTASGDAAPLRVIRSATLSQGSPGMSNPHSVAYDAKREEILVPS
ncbi:MAG: hypothetical protein HY647_00825 [Acidobacteria bacterium]|nr:hypothetical protein [Acidobacteriota bacterium]